MKLHKKQPIWNSIKNGRFQMILKYILKTEKEK